MKQVIFSGIQPSGIIHLGNYLGAIKQWLGYINEYQSYFCIVDLHAITVRQKPEVLKENIYKLAALYLACGLDPQKSTLFIQSHVPAHAELAWILNCSTQIGELERMTQFKDKAKQHKENINVGLFAYPVLMAADILLYNANFVPVGEDQKQHVELARDIAGRFNHHFGDVFVLPKCLLPKTGARIMGLDNPSKKMSKSAVSDMNYVALLDEPAIIKKKIQKAVTDSGSDIIFDPAKKPAISNLLTIYSLLTGKTIKEIEKKYQGSGYGKFKSELAETVVEFLQPIQKKYQTLMNDRKYLNKILQDGAQKAEQIANETLNKAHKAIGIR
jgi:tryptophanyl-tRNA synthetase